MIGPNECSHGNLRFKCDACNMGAESALSAMTAESVKEAESYRKKCEDVQRLAGQRSILLDEVAKLEKERDEAEARGRAVVAEVVRVWLTNRDEDESDLWSRVMSLLPAAPSTKEGK
jgi:flagellar biosynthesis/type III secretory pathway chaperone